LLAAAASDESWAARVAAYQAVGAPNLDWRAGAGEGRGRVGNRTYVVGHSWRPSPRHSCEQGLCHGLEHRSGHDGQSCRSMQFI